MVGRIEAEITHLIISREAGFVFMKTRRTGGSSFESWMYQHLDENDTITGSVNDGTPRMNCPDGITGHIPTHKIRELFPDIPDDYFWFCVERNSYEKAVSDWLYHRDVIGDGYTTLGGHLASVNVSDWARYSAEKGIHVIQFDKFVRFLSIVGVHLKPNKYNFYLRDYYDGDTADLVQRMFKHEIKRFGYTL